jgi:hypothetical protein
MFTISRLFVQSSLSACCSLQSSERSVLLSELLVTQQHGEIKSCSAALSGLHDYLTDDNSSSSVSVHQQYTLVEAQIWGKSIQVLIYLFKSSRALEFPRTHNNAIICMVISMVETIRIISDVSRDICSSAQSIHICQPVRTCKPVCLIIRIQTENLETSSERAIFEL